MAFANQVALITGASSGIGWALAKQLAKDKCHVGLIARRKERLDALAEECRALGVKAAVAMADVSDRQQTLQAIASIREQLGPIDLLIANSGIGIPTLLEPMNTEEIDYMIRVNYLGVIYAIEGVLPEMLKRGKGHVSAVSSLAGYATLPGESGYCSSKAAVIVYLASLRSHLKPLGIAVTTICPGFIETPMIESDHFPKPWLMSAEKAAQKIVEALEKRKGVYNFPWQTTLLIKATAWLPDFFVRWIMGDITQKKQDAHLAAKKTL